jgi:hypothetical protein
MKKIKEKITKITYLEVDVEVIKDLYNSKKATDFDMFCLEHAEKHQKNNITRLKRTMENNDISWRVVGWGARNIGKLLNDKFEKLYQVYLRKEKLERICNEKI